MLSVRSQAGDTIVEVLFASALFSMVAVTSLGLMGQGIATAARSLELTQVRAQMDTQARALRFLADAYVSDYGKNGRATSLWHQIIEPNAIAAGQAQQFSDVVSNNECVLPVSKAFTLDTAQLNKGDRALLQPHATPLTYARIRYDEAKPKAEGIWIQAIRSAETEDQTGYYDFHIIACWESPGQQRPVSLGTIVRVYEPRG